MTYARKFYDSIKAHPEWPVGRHAAAVGYPARKASACIAHMVKKGRLRRTKRGHYSVAGPPPVAHERRGRKPGANYLAKRDEMIVALAERVANLEAEVETLRHGERKGIFGRLFNGANGHARAT